METTQTETKRRLTFDDEAKWLDEHGFIRITPKSLYHPRRIEYKRQDSIFTILFHVSPLTRKCEMYVLAFGQIFCQLSSNPIYQVLQDKPVVEHLFELAMLEIDSLNESFKHVADAMGED